MSWDDGWAPLHWDAGLSSQKGSRMAVAATFMLHMYDCWAQGGGGGWEWESGKAMKRKKERVSVVWISFIILLLLISLSQRNERYRRSSSSHRHTYQLSKHSSHQTTFFFLLTFFLLSSPPNTTRSLPLSLNQRIGSTVIGIISTQFFYYISL